MEPQTTRKPSSTPSLTRNDGGNLQLMEARLIELVSSLRALSKSNRELVEALATTCPGDVDFVDAVTENRTAMRRRINLANELIRDMKLRGSTVDLPEDIRAIDLSELDEVVEMGAGGGGLYL